VAKERVARAPDPALPYLTLPYLTLLYLTLPYLTLPYLTLPYPQIRELHVAKERAVRAEDYDAAKRLKEAMERLKQVRSEKRVKSRE